MDVYSQIAGFIDSGCHFCVATVFVAEGSTPREAGVKAIVDGTGRIHGTVGGGGVEAETQRRAVEACRSGRAAMFELELRGETAAGRESICGGIMRILVDPTAAKDRAAYIAAAAALEHRRRGILLTVVREGGTTDTEVIWHSEEEVRETDLAGALGGPQVARTCLTDARARLVEADDSVYVLVEPVIPGPLLLIAGGGHIGQALAAQGSFLGFDVVVIDDRPDFTDPGLFPEGVKTHCADIPGGVADHAVDDDTYIVIVTRGHRHDAETLRACIHKPAAYIGMIGSRRKVALIRESFLAGGLATEEELDAVHAPIGFDIGAETVPEIAASIAAQLTAVRRRGHGGSIPRDMRDR